ncbi:MFS transporter [Erwinia sp. E_sp_B01_9]|uniref:MFS transporter n=1 Tax=Erwinia sp. E_sp_B01_9 TaxID=3039403 RepID=UPI003D9AD9F0
MAAEPLTMPRFWLHVAVSLAASIYDVFDQQFANFLEKLLLLPRRAPRYLAMSPLAASC